MLESQSDGSPSPPRRPLLYRGPIVAAILLGFLLRISVVAWSDPWQPHHPDEHILPLEALALWEGITPREVGWPASTTRIILSAGAALQWGIEAGRTAWHERHAPDRALESVSVWIGRRYVDPSALYRLGRMVSVIIGCLQVVAVAWAARRWTGPRGVLIATSAAAIAPLAVLYSQYVLADMTGVLFATIVVGLAGEPTDRGFLAMAAFAGLAAASKFHFGLWLLVPLTGIWVRSEPALLRKKVSLSLAAAGLAAWIVVTLVPWAWINPVLALKEFGSVVVAKAGGVASVNQVLANVTTLFGGLGVLVWLGVLLGFAAMGRTDLRRLAPILLPLVIGTMVLAGSAFVFDRYGLVLLPGLLILCGYGWERWLGVSRRGIQFLTVALLVVSAVWTMTTLSRDESLAAETDVDVLAKQWVLAHVSRGARVAVHDEVNTFFPRTNGQLRACLSDAETSAMYREKWRRLGVDAPAAASEPMRLVLLNDELFRAYWCRRELAAQTDPGFVVVPYHNEPRLGAVLEHDAIREFQQRDQVQTGGIDVLVLNREVNGAVAPAQILRTHRGQRVIYMR